MLNKTQVECYFKSDEMAAICKGSTDIVITFHASYPPDAPPVFDIHASGMSSGAKTGAKATAKAAKPLGGGGGGIGGCPKPC